MADFTIDQRVTTTVDAPSMWPGGFSAPAGSTGTITSVPVNGNPTYGVLLDADPDQMPLSYTAAEITPA